MEEKCPLFIEKYLYLKWFTQVKLRLSCLTEFFPAFLSDGLQTVSKEIKSAISTFFELVWSVMLDLQPCGNLVDQS